MANPDAADIIALTGASLSTALVDILIDQAALIAADCLAGASDELETAALFWLTAHLVASTSKNGALVSRKIGDATDTFASTTIGDGINGTSYGQQAVALLPCLGTIGKSVASLEVI